MSFISFASSALFAMNLNWNANCLTATPLNKVLMFGSAVTRKDAAAPSPISVGPRLASFAAPSFASELPLVAPAPLNRSMKSPTALPTAPAAEPFAPFNAPASIAPAEPILGLS